MIGGATTSRLHVALKIAPVYGGPVVWMKDASRNAPTASRLLNKTERGKYKKELDAEYEGLRAEYTSVEQKIISLEEARKNKLDLFSEDQSAS